MRLAEANWNPAARKKGALLLVEDVLRLIISLFSLVPLI